MICPVCTADVISIAALRDWIQQQHEEARRMREDGYCHTSPQARSFGIDQTVNALSMMLDEFDAADPRRKDSRPSAIRSGCA